LLALREWLSEQRVTHVAIEATGVYWKPIYYMQEDRVELLLVNPAHFKQVPGRRTDAAGRARDDHGLAQLNSSVKSAPLRARRD